MDADPYTICVGTGMIPEKLESGRGVRGKGKREAYDIPTQKRVLHVILPVCFYLRSETPTLAVIKGVVPTTLVVFVEPFSSPHNNAAVRPGIEVIHPCRPALDVRLEVDVVRLIEMGMYWLLGDVMTVHSFVGDDCGGEGGEETGGVGVRR